MASRIFFGVLISLLFTADAVADDVMWGTRAPFQAESRVSIDFPPIPADVTIDLGLPESTAALRSAEPFGRLRVGMVRPVKKRFTITNRDDRIAKSILNGSTFHSLRVTSATATALRVVLTGHLPPGANVFFSDDEERQTFGPYEVDRSEPLFTNTIFGSSAVVHIRSTAGSLTPDHWIELDSVIHMSEPIPSPEGTECLVDARCYGTSTWPVIDDARDSVARLLFVDGSNAYVCSGALVNDTVDGFIPYFLTANHCFSTQGVANSLEAFWNYQTPSCNGAAPNPSTLPRTRGATILASSAESDFTFVQLKQDPPGDRFYLGWDSRTSVLTNGLRVFRLHHPGGNAQSFAANDIFTSNVTRCNLSTTKFVYSTEKIGGTVGGSSGAPLVTSEGRILGQLLGACGSNLENPCDHVSNFTVDGAFHATYPFIRQWLRPESGATPPPCVPSTNTFCTWSQRFEVRLSARDQRSGRTDNGLVMSSTDVYGLYALPNITFNTTDPALFVKVLDGRPVNGKWWVFIATLTDVEFTVTVRDTTTGTTRNFYKAPGETNATFNTDAF